MQHFRFLKHLFFEQDRYEAPKYGFVICIHMLHNDLRIQN